MEKKKTKRDYSKYKGLDISVNLPIRKEELEVDYLDKLNESELAWLDKFNRQEIIADEEEFEAGKLTKEEKAEKRNRNYIRNEDALGRSKVRKLLDGEVKVPESTDKQSANEVEDRLIQMIDIQNAVNAALKPVKKRI